ncbi:hypothetical protein [Pandoraea anhela]|uniref:Uncharacterized protein n=1 Tax=Pandoraea anhela TaxID=2508295 RepID=A0A5E4T8K3_9BURK|nr:hypothetical protein [Pandoraea anhela]VVD83542.1 hypothetical protein PAN31108_01236 [Pandoraea anhela]
MESNDSVTMVVPLDPPVPPRRVRTARSGLIEIMDDKPNVLSVDIAAQAPLPDGFPANRLLSTAWSANPLTLTSVLLADWGAGDFIRVMYDGAQLMMREITQAEQDAGAISFDIPAPRPDGLHRASYSVISSITGDESDQSDPTTFIVDTERPGIPRLGRLDLPDGVEDGGLSDSTLTALGDELPLTISGYTGRIDGDLVTVYVVNAANGSTAQFSQRIGLGESGNPLEIKIPRTAIETLGDGNWSVTYDITDLAGNTSPRSTSVTFPVFVSEGIDDLGTPVVVLFDDNNLINESDARTPVRVGIPLNASIQSGDQIVVLWGTARLDPRPIPDPVGTDDPMLNVDVPYATVAASGAAGGNVNVNVTYEVWRAGRLIGSPATAKTVIVNLDQSGGIDPDPITPENEKLAAPTVRNASWAAGDRENYIPVEDSRNAASMIIPWLNTDTPTGADAFIENDVINLYYGVDPITDATAVPFATITVSAADVAAKAPLVRPIPAATIIEFGTGTWLASYSSTRQVRAAGAGVTAVTNTAYSPKQNVVVESATDLPGGGDPIAAPFFEKPLGYTDGTALGYLSCFVPSYVNMKEDDLLRIHITARFRRNGTGGPVNKAEFGHAGDTAIVNFPFEKYVGRNDVDGRVEFRYPWVRIQYLYKICQVFAQVTVTNRAGQSVTSQQSMILCDTRVNPTPPDDPERPDPAA